MTPKEKAKFWEACAVAALYNGDRSQRLDEAKRAAEIADYMLNERCARTGLDTPKKRKKKPAWFGG